MNEDLEQSFGTIRQNLHLDCTVRWVHEMRLNASSGYPLGFPLNRKYIKHPVYSGDIASAQHSHSTKHDFSPLPCSKLWFSSNPSNNRRPKTSTMALSYPQMLSVSTTPLATTYRHRQHRVLPYKMRSSTTLILPALSQSSHEMSESKSIVRLTMESPGYSIRNNPKLRAEMSDSEPLTDFEIWAEDHPRLET